MARGRVVLAFAIANGVFMVTWMHFAAGGCIAGCDAPGPVPGQVPAQVPGHSEHRPSDSAGGPAARAGRVLAMANLPGDPAASAGQLPDGGPEGSSRLGPGRDPLCTNNYKTT
eukprot:gene9355-8397_t